MAEPLRIWESDAIYFVTNRCMGRQLRLRPDQQGLVQAVLLGCLARCLQKYPRIELFAFVFMSNHFHLLLRAPALDLSDFMRDLQQMIARELNRLQDKVGTRLWARRFSASKILDDAALRDKVNYIHTNPCAAHLVARPGDWGQLSSFWLLDEGRTLEGRWVDRDELRRLRRKDPDCPEKDAERSAPIELTPLPRLAQADQTVAQDELKADAVQEARKLGEARRARGKRVLGMKRVRRQSPFDTPKSTRQSSPRPRCHASCPDKRAAYLETCRQTIDRHRREAERWRAGRTDLSFPAGTFPPGWSRPVGAKEARRKRVDAEADPPEVSAAA